MRGITRVTGLLAYLLGPLTLQAGFYRGSAQRMSSSLGTLITAYGLSSLLHSFGSRILRDRIFKGTKMLP